MKIILAPTDFSEAARNSVMYAAALAKETNSRLILFHSYHPPVITTEVPVVIPSLDEIEKAALETLEKIANEIRPQFNIAIEIACKCGFATETISTYARECSADYIVAGMQGRSKIEEKLVGSVTTSLMREASNAVFCVPSNAKFKPFKRILFAADLNEDGMESCIDRVRDLATRFNAQVDVLNVVKDLAVLPDAKEATQGVKLEYSLQGVEHTFNVIENDDVVNGILTYAVDNASDLVVMIPRHHNFFAALLNESKSKKLAFHTYLPLLTIHS